MSRVGLHRFHDLQFTIAMKGENPRFLMTLSKAHSPNRHSRRGHRTPTAASLRSMARIKNQSGRIPTSGKKKGVGIKICPPG
jgi:hypothetical protein